MLNDSPDTRCPIIRQFLDYVPCRNICPQPTPHVCWHLICDYWDVSMNKTGYIPIGREMINVHR